MRVFVVLPGRRAEAIDGKRRQIRKGGYPNKTAAREALGGYVQRRLANGEQVGGSLTVAEYLEDWLKAKRAAGRRDSTLAQIDYVDNYLEPVLGHVRLSELRAKHVDDSGLKTGERGSWSAHPAPGAGRPVIGPQHRREAPPGLLQCLPSGGDRPGAHADQAVYDGKQLAKFLSHVKDHRLAALWRLYALVGLRRGEALALTWSMVNFDASTVRIERSLGIVNGHLAWGPPKSDSGRRTLALDAATLAILRGHKARQNAEKLALGAGYAMPPTLCSLGRMAGALRPEFVSKRFWVLTDEVKLPSIHLQRPTTLGSSMALVAGVPMKVVSENLGHSSLGITAYLTDSHVTLELARDCCTGGRGTCR